MVTYEITSTVEPALVDRYELYMRGTHIPDLLATGCFSGASLSRSEPGRYRIRYEARTHDDLDRYLTTHAERLLRDFAAHLPSGITVSREVWATLEGWPTPQR